MSGHRRRWRDYSTSSGNRPVRDFIRGLSDDDAATIVAAMKEVAEEGLRAARHLRGDIYEVRAHADRVSYRVLFATEGQRGQVLLALEAFRKASQKTSPASIRLAERRLRDWRSRARSGLSR
jgi:phage-related protein